jgi:hypothetical protein
MDTPSSKTMVVAKLAVVFVVLGGLVAAVGSGLAPQVPLWLLIVVGVGAALGLFVVLVVAIACSSWVRQLVLRNGGTDTQWLWFPRDPPGLEKIRGGNGKGERL